MVVSESDGILMAVEDWIAGKEEEKGPLYLQCNLRELVSDRQTAKVETPGRQKVSSCQAGLPPVGVFRHPQSSDVIAPHRAQQEKVAHRKGKHTLSRGDRVLYQDGLLAWPDQTNSTSSPSWPD